MYCACPGTASPCISDIHGGAGAGGLAENQPGRYDDLTFALFAVDFQKKLVERVPDQFRVVDGECGKRRRLERRDGILFVDDERNIPGNLPATVPDCLGAARNPFDRDQNEGGESLFQQSAEVHFHLFRTARADVADRFPYAVLPGDAVELIQAAVAFPVGGYRSAQPGDLPVSQRDEMLQCLPAFAVRVGHHGTHIVEHPSEVVDDHQRNVVLPAPFTGNSFPDGEGAVDQLAVEGGYVVAGKDDHVEFPLPGLRDDLIDEGVEGELKPWNQYPDGFRMFAGRVPIVQLFRQCEDFLPEFRGDIRLPVQGAGGLRDRDAQIHRDIAQRCLSDRTHLRCLLFHVSAIVLL